MFFKKKIRLTNSTLVVLETARKAINFALKEGNVSLLHMHIEPRTSSEKWTEFTIQGEIIYSSSESDYKGKVKVGVNMYLENLEAGNSLWKIKPFSLIVVSVLGEANLHLKFELTEESDGTINYRSLSKNKDLIPYNEIDWCMKDYGFKF